MTQQVWKIERGVTNVTTQVQSFSYSTGRRTQFDSWAPGSLVLTIRNQSGQANSYDLNDKITLTALPASFFQEFYVQEILFNDLPGNGAASTATIICTDLLGRMGRIQVFEQALTSQGTLEQLNNEFNSLMPTGTNIVNVSNGDSTAAADASYSGTVLNRLNLNMITEQGWLAVTDVNVYLFGRSDLAALAPGVITFAREASGLYQMGYSDIKRISLGSNYLNTCTVTPDAVAATNAEDAIGIAAYGYYGAEFSTVDNSTTQAFGLASWQVFSRDDPDELSFEISLSDTVNDLTELFTAIYLDNPVVTVSYKKPGDATTYTSSQIMNGFTMSVTPAATFMEIFTSPLTYTNFFILDSATFGVLDKSRLGW